jgi:peroxiredoxin
VTKKLIAALITISVLSALQQESALPSPAEDSVSGLWDATVQVGLMEVPFRFGIAAHSGRAEGWFFNADQRVVSTGGTLTPNHLTLDFATYARRLDVAINDDGTLNGTYVPTKTGSTAQPYLFQAHRAATSHPSSHEKVPPIAGLWLVPAQSRKANEHAWRFIVRQSGPDVTAAMLRVDGDTGALTGSWHDGKLLLSHFDGARPSVIEVAPSPDGTLQLLVSDTHGADVALVAYRLDDAHAKGLPEPADPSLHTTFKNGEEPFQFNFPDLDGRAVSNTDARFKGKVLVIDVSGSWCPNCHDEAPFLEALYKKYQHRGLEIVTLSFEEAEQLADPERLRAFIKDYGIEYTVLLAGTTQELHTKLPQAVDLDAYPTTFFIGRDGRVRGVHAGFAAPATGDFNVRLKKDFTSRIEQLLAERTGQ